MVILDISAVNVALPDLANDLGIGAGDIGWAITSYSLIFGSLLLLGGRAADLLGRRRMFLTGLGIFTASSFASAMAGTAGALFAARAGQGLGAAMLSPAALAIIMTAFQGNQRAKALAAWGAVGGAGAGALIGSAVGHTGAGAAIGGVLGLGAGALVGDQLQGQENTNQQQQQQIQANQTEIERQRQELQRMKRNVKCPFLAAGRCMPTGSPWARTCTCAGGSALRVMSTSWVRTSAEPSTSPARP
jgi:predicted MFS family arabinose efflux permease